jgi:hypothetical protein
MGVVPEKHQSHAAKHLTRSSRNPAEKAEIKFSPAVVDRFRDLETAVREKGHFDSDVLKNLEHWASGKGGAVSLALGDMIMITQETMKHIQATGNQEAKQALSMLFGEMIGPHSATAPVVKTFRRSR